jgi:hypothetical protein
MRVAGLLSFVVLALLLGACVSTVVPAPPPHYLITLSPPSSDEGTSTTLGLPLRVDDLREAQDRARVGEIHAPGGGALPVIGGGGASPAVAVGVAIILFAPTFPTGHYLLVRDPAEVALAIERALVSAWLKSAHPATAGLGLEASVRRFWIQPSWTTTCELSVDLRLRDDRGAVLWQQTVDSRVDEFLGLSAVEGFERVARMALDQFVDQAAAAFASPAFAAAVSADP